MTSLPAARARACSAWPPDLVAEIAQICGLTAALPRWPTGYGGRQGDRAAAEQTGLRPGTRWRRRGRPRWSCSARACGRPSPRSGGDLLAEHAAAGQAAHRPSSGSGRCATSRLANGCWRGSGFCGMAMRCTGRLLRHRDLGRAQPRRGSVRRHGGGAAGLPPGSNGVFAILSNLMNARCWVHASPSFLQFDVNDPAGSGRAAASARSRRPPPTWSAATSDHPRAHRHPRHRAHLHRRGGRARSGRRSSRTCSAASRPAVTESSALGAARAPGGAGVYSSLTDLEAELRTGRPSSPPGGGRPRSELCRLARDLPVDARSRRKACSTRSGGRPTPALTRHGAQQKESIMADNETAHDAATEGGRFSRVRPRRPQPYTLKGLAGLDWGCRAAGAGVPAVHQPHRDAGHRPRLLPGPDHGSSGGPEIVPLLRYADALMTTRWIVRSTIRRVRHAHRAAGQRRPEHPAGLSDERSRSAWRTPPGSMPLPSPSRCSSAASSRRSRCAT